MSGSWLKNNTFHHSRFEDLALLVKEKNAQGLTISVCFPTCNEEATIGEAVRIIKSELMDRWRLVDEIAVIDSGSSDRTVEKARAAGADVHLAGECLTHLGHNAGKGENLWKSLFLLKGDILVWLDADIKNMHPKFVYGLAGPLLLYPEIMFTKAYYERPLHRPEEEDEYGGGRVTETRAPPLSTAFSPARPHSTPPGPGHGAARRELLENLPFAAGYGIETGMLIDIHHRYGQNVIAQVNLDKRIHRNQSITALGKMGFEILHTFISRLQALDRAHFHQTPASEYLRLICGPSLYHLEQAPVQLAERPPMKSIPEYQRRRGSNA
jgi:glucosyl-3-phosphoglycerate synthase